MLRYCWNDFMIDGQLGSDRIVIDAVPTNVNHISGEEEGIQRIEKAFQGEITTKILSKEIGQQWKHLKNIEKMYDYFCGCINQAEKMRTGQTQASKSMQRIWVSRQWCKDEGINHKKQRLIVKILLMNSSGSEVKQEQPEYLIVKLKEMYLTINGLLLKCNKLVLSELGYLRQMEDRQTEKMNELYHKMQKKMKQQLDFHKEELKTMIQSMFKQKDKTSEDTSSAKQKKMKKKHQITSEEIKYQEETSYQPKKKYKKQHKTIETLSQLKSETEIKYEQDQQCLRLKLLQQSQPQKVIPIPIQFDQDNPAYHFFLFSDKSAKKMGGFDYPMAILKHIIPQQGTHGTMINYAQQKSRRVCCLQIGIIDQNIKKLFHSSVSDNYVFFKFNISSVCTKVNGVEKKKRFKRLRVLIPGESVGLRVNLRLGIISWTFSYGVTIRSEIPIELRKMNMQPFVGIFTTGDMVRFQDYPTTTE